LALEGRRLNEIMLSWWLIIDVNSILGLLYSVVVGNVVDRSQVLAASICDPEDGGSMYLRLLAASSTTTWCNNPRTELRARRSDDIMIQEQ
jgi:hypothetical protein